MWLNDIMNVLLYCFTPSLHHCITHSLTASLVHSPVPELHERSLGLLVPWSTQSPTSCGQWHSRLYLHTRDVRKKHLNGEWVRKWVSEWVSEWVRSVRGWEGEESGKKGVEWRRWRGVVEGLSNIVLWLFRQEERSAYIAICQPHMVIVVPIISSFHLLTELKEVVV